MRLVDKLFIGMKTNQPKLNKTNRVQLGLCSRLRRIIFDYISRLKVVSSSLSAIHFLQLCFAINPFPLSAWENILPDVIGSLNVRMLLMSKGFKTLR